jgi:hypothetical protein
MSCRQAVTAAASRTRTAPRRSWLALLEAFPRAFQVAFGRALRRALERAFGRALEI